MVNLISEIKTYFCKNKFDFALKEFPLDNELIEGFGEAYTVNKRSKD